MPIPCTDGRRHRWTKVKLGWFANKTIETCDCGTLRVTRHRATWWSRGIQVYYRLAPTCISAERGTSIYWHDRAFN